MSEEQKRQLNQQLWNIANTLRGKMDADEFRDYILGFIFYKYLSEKMELYANEILKEDKIKYLDISEDTAKGQEYLEAIKEESLEKLGYFLKPSELFGQVAKRGNGNGKNESKFIIEDIQKILINIQNSTMGTASEEDFDHLFEDMDLNSTKLGRTAEQRNEVIAKVLAHLDKIDFQLEQSKIDVLGDAYEYLIGQFASGAGKKAGEFYTPQQASKILARIVTLGKTRIKSAYDPTCGSGSLILRLGRICDVLKFYGQERNRTTYNLCRMNMILHDVHHTRFDIKLEDTLEHPQHDKLDAEAVVANPPFSAKWSASPLFMTDDRFSEYGKLAPSSKADFAFIQHMIYHLAENGVMAVVMPHGVLYRGGAEGHIRKYIIEEKNYLDSVIGLPENIFYGTSIATCILVFKKCREHPNNILFIDASQYYEKIKNQNFLRDEDVDRIVNAYESRTNIDRYCSIADIEDIRNNDYNLNIPRYVNNFINEVAIDIQSVCNRMDEISAESKQNDKYLQEICKEIGIPFPDSSNLSLLLQYKTGIMQKIFSQEIKFKGSDGSNFPEWDIKRFGDVYSFKGNNSFSRDNLNYESGSVKNIHHGDIHTKFGTLFDINKEIVPFINQDVDISKTPEDFYLKEGDLIFADASEDYNDVGKNIEVVRLNGQKVLSGLHTILARPDKVPMALGFAGYLMKINYIRIQIQKEAQGTKVLGISSRRLSNIMIPIPSLIEQRKIADLFHAIDNKIHYVQMQI